MTTLALTLATLGFRTSGRESAEAGSVDFDSAASFPGNVDRDIRCVSGHLWVTLENDPNDFVLGPGECLHVAGRGKVVIGGQGSYRVRAVVPPALAS